MRLKQQPRCCLTAASLPHPLSHCRAPRRIQLTGSPSDSSIGPSWLIQGVSSPPSPTLWFNRPGALELTEAERHALMALNRPLQPHPTTDDLTTAAAARSHVAAAVPPRSSGGRYSALQYGAILPPGPAIAQPPSPPGPAAVDGDGRHPHDSGTPPSYDGARALIFHKHAAIFAADMHLLMMAAVKGRAAAGEGATGSSAHPDEGPAEETPSWPWLPLPATVGTLGGRIGGREPDSGFDSGSNGMGASDVSSLLLSPEEREAADVVEVAPELLAFLLEQKMWACFELAVRECPCLILNYPFALRLQVLPAHPGPSHILSSDGSCFRPNHANCCRCAGSMTLER